MIDDDHLCPDEDADGYYMCIDGRIFGPCEWVGMCGGACEAGQDCTCECHADS